MDIWHMLLGAAIGALIGWLTAIAKKKNTQHTTSTIVINTIVGTAGGLIGALAFWVMTKLAVMQIVGVIIMALAGTITMLWVLSRIKNKESDTTNS